MGFGQIRQHNIEEIHRLSASFNAGLREALDLLLPHITDLIEELGWPDVKLSALHFGGVTYNEAGIRNERDFDGQEVTPELTFHGQELPTPQTFLNEARLSALALAIYFAGRQVCAATLQPDTPRLMVLDDVLIGLDQSNRLPVLDVLDAHFSDWQIVLLTHDRVWFEMARSRLADRGDWAVLEMFEETEPTGAIRPVLRKQDVDPVQSNIDAARRFFAANHYSAAAVHTRIAFEASLKKLCNSKRIPVPYRAEPRKQTTEELLDAIEKWLGEPKRATAKAAVDPAIQAVKLYRQVVLNPFSHSTPVNVAKAEVDGAIDAVEKLHTAFKERIK